MQKTIPTFTLSINDICKTEKQKAKFRASIKSKSEDKKEDGFMLVALEPFKQSGLDINIGDRVGGRMTFTQAVKEAKKQNVGQSVGCTKRVEIKPFVKFESSWQIQMRKSFLSALDKKRS